MKFVGIGASAGGLEAITELFRFMPDSAGLTFIIVQHVSPDYRSILHKLLAKSTSLQVETIKDGTKPLSNHIYLLPPNNYVTLFNRKLFLETMTKRTDPEKLPIDHFFSSLAKDIGSDSIGIILSGTGNDGTLGCKKIKQYGGLVIVQTESSAQYGGMINSVINNDLADLVLTTKEIGQHLFTLTD